MHNLRAIGERHPENIFKDLMDCSGLAESSICSIYKLIRHAPSFIIDGQKLNDLATFLEVSYKNKHKTKACPDFRSSINLVRNVLEYQIERINQGVSRVYLEGVGGNNRFLVNYILDSNRSISLTFLDYKNPIYEKIGALEFSKLNEEGFFYKLKRYFLQTMREREWVKMIDSSPEIERSLLIAGTAHTRGDYGLPGRLRRKGINLIVEKEF